MLELFERAAKDNGLVTAFAVVGAIVLISGIISRRLTFGRVQGSAIAILIGLLLAWIGGKVTGGKNGLADIAIFSGVGLMGGNMLRLKVSMPKLQPPVADAEAFANAIIAALQSR